MTTKAKAPGFWFYPGDWMKDPELRFCSLFARGLLVDLLCLMFESKQRGYLSKPDGSPRSDDAIVDSIAGGSREEKLAALDELESSGVLSRDNRGVLYSRRLARLGELSAARSKAGSKGGSKQASKTQANGAANRQANTQANEKQNRGVSASVSVSDSDKNSPSLSLKEPLEESTDRPADRPPDPPPVRPDPATATDPTSGSPRPAAGRGAVGEGPTATPTDPAPDPAWADDWGRWIASWESRTGRRLDAVTAEVQLMQLHALSPAKAAADLRFSLQKSAKSILDSDDRYGGNQNASKRQAKRERLVI